MGARTRTDSHQRAVVGWPAGHVVAFSFSVVMALSGAWVPSAASASPESRGESDVRPSRGPKPTERSCSPGESSPERDTESPPSRGRRLGYRHRSAAPVQPAASSGGDSRDDCPEDEPSGAASSGDQRAEGRRANARPSGSPEARDPSSEGERSAPVPRPAARRQARRRRDRGPVPGPSRMARRADRSLPTPTPPERTTKAPTAAGRVAGAHPVRAASGDRATPKSPSGGARNAFSGGRGRRTGSGDRRPGGSAGAGRGGNEAETTVRPAPTSAAHPAATPTPGSPGFGMPPPSESASTVRVSARVRCGSRDGAAVQPGDSLDRPSPSTAAAALAAPGRATVAATAIPRTGGEISASTVLALLLVSWSAGRCAEQPGTSGREPGPAAEVGQRGGVHRQQGDGQQGQPAAVGTMVLRGGVDEAGDGQGQRCGVGSGGVRIGAADQRQDARWRSGATDRVGRGRRHRERRLDGRVGHRCDRVLGRRGGRARGRRGRPGGRHSGPAGRRGRRRGGRRASPTGGRGVAGGRRGGRGPGRGRPGVGGAWTGRRRLRGDRLGRPRGGGRGGGAGAVPRQVSLPESLNVSPGIGTNRQS